VAIGLLQAGIVWAMVVECVVLCWIIAMPTWSFVWQISPARVSR